MGLTFALAIVAALIAGLLKSEIEGWMPWAAERLRRLALRAFEGPIHERLDEEWAAYLEETPGYIGKIVSAIGFVWTAVRVQAASSTRRAAYAGTGRLMQLLLATSSRLSKLSAPMSAASDRGQFVQRFGQALQYLSLRMFMAGLLIYAWRVCLIEDPDLRAKAHQKVLESFEDLSRQLTAALSQFERTKN